MSTQPQAESSAGVFRTRWRGFDKQDVLQYIDSLVGQHAQMLATQEAELEALREETNAQRQVIGRADLLAQQLEEMRGHVEKAAEAEAECLRLQVELGQAAERQAALQRQIDELTATKQRYEALVGDVGTFLMELHALGQRFLETAYQRSEQCLTSAQTAVDGLSRQWAEAVAEVQGVSARLAGARQELSDQSESAGLRLHEMVQRLEQTASACQEKGVSAE